MSEETPHRISVNGIFGVNTRTPLVQIEIPEALLRPVMRRGERGPEPMPGLVGLQLALDDAREIGMNLLQAAEFALTDGFLLTFLEKELGMTLEELAPLLAKLRGYRQQNEREGT